MSTSADNWNLFQVPQVENSTSSYEYVEIREQSNAPIITDRKLTFRMNNVDAYTLPNQAFLEVKFYVRRTESTNINPGQAGNIADGAVTLENGAPLFSDATYRINGKIIERVEYLHKKILVSNLLEYSEDYARSSASDQFWYPDTGTLGDAVSDFSISAPAAGGLEFFTVAGDDVGVRTLRVTNSAVTVNQPVGGAPQVLGLRATGDYQGRPNPEYNEGWTKRLALTANSKLVVLRIPLARIFGYCKSVQLVSTGVQHEIELFRTDNVDIFHASDPGPDPMNTANNRPILEISKASIWMPHLKPSLSTAVAIEKMLSQGGSQIIPFEYTNVYRLTGQETQSINWLFKSATERPTKCVFFFQQEIDPADAKNTYYVNKSKFDPLNVVRASLTVMGTKIPEYDFESNFDSAKLDYSRLYNELMRVSDKHPMDYNTGTQISYKQFGELYPLICFDLRDQAEKLFTPGVASDMTFRANLGSNVGAKTYYTTKYSIYAVLFSERVMRLDVLNRSTFLDVQ
jgi:hypothetical protein